MLQKLGLQKSIAVTELGNDWLKIIEIRNKSVVNAQFIKLAQIKGNVADEMGKIFTENNITRQVVYTYIPRHLVTVRIMEFPSKNPKEIQDMVDLQIGKQTPYSKEEIITSYKTTESEREGYTKVILVIVRKTLISDRLEAFRRSGLEIKKLTVSSEGTFNWFVQIFLPSLKREDISTAVVVDIDSNFADFIVVRNKEMLFSRHILIGSNQLREDLDRWHEKFVEEMKRSIDRFRTENRNVKLDKVFLAGGAYSVNNLDSLLSKGIDVPVETLDPLANIPGADKLDVLKDESVRSISISPLLGIGLKPQTIDIDLMPTEKKIQKMMELKRRSLTVMGGLLIALVMVISLNVLIFMYNKKGLLLQLKQKIAQTEKEATAVEKMRLRIDLVKKRLNAQGSSINILDEIYLLTPKEIHFTTVTIEEKKQATLKGQAYAMSDVFKFITTLEKSGYFENVKTTYTTTKKKKDFEYVDFEIICLYQKQK